MPGVNELPDRPAMPDVLTMNNGKKVTTAAQWKQRREERIIEYYAVGQALPCRASKRPVRGGPQMVLRAVPLKRGQYGDEQPACA